MIHYSLDRVLALWRQSVEVQKADPNLEKYLRLAIRLYVLPVLEDKGRNLNCPSSYLELPVEQLHNALEIFDQQSSIAMQEGRLAKGTKDNYRSALKRFTCWLEQQVWWREILPESITRNDVAPYRVKLEGKLTGGQRTPYRLNKEKLPQYLLDELDEFRQFRLTGGRSIRRSWQERRRDGERRTRKPKMEAVGSETCNREENAILRFFGWYAMEYPDDKPGLELLTDVELLDDYVYWALETRRVSHATAVEMTSVAVSIAKWLNYQKSTRRNWLDVPIVLELQDLRSEYSEIYEIEKKQRKDKKWSQKKLTHEQARQVVQYLQKLCAPNYGRHDKKTGEFIKHGTRSSSAVARAWQTYLLVKILVYCPVRQEELRNLKLGETIFRYEDEQGNPYYEVKLKKHKLYSRTRKPRHYRLPAILTEDLDLWVYEWRPWIVESVKTLESWIEFWDYGDGKVERIRDRLQAAKQGTVNERVTNSLEQYIEQENSRLQGAENRIAAWPLAKANLEEHNYLFFLLGKHKPESFGKPHYVASVWRLVNRAIARATKTLFDDERWTNPHALRHIAEAHIRLSGKAHIAEAFGTLIGHSKEMGDEYAEQVISEYELTEDIVDDWWEEL